MPGKFIEFEVEAQNVDANPNDKQLRRLKTRMSDFIKRQQFWYQTGQKIGDYQTSCIRFQYI